MKLGAVPLLLLIRLLDTSTANAFFLDPTDACDVQARRAGVSLGDGFSTGPLAYRSLCDPDLPGYRARGLFDPVEQYPGLDPCIETSDWPRCVRPAPSAAAAPDVGYRYPLRLRPGTRASRTRQDPDQDGWPVCADRNLSRIVSDPLATRCPDRLQPVGRCQPSAHHYEKLNGAAYGVPATVFHSFVLTHADCEPCAHDAYSAVATCHALCDRYFGTLGFDPSAVEWRVMGDGRTLGTERIRSLYYCNDLDRRPPCPMTPLEICRTNCGPPFVDVDGQRDMPPWVSGWRPRPLHELLNHWYFVHYGRAWDPNDTLNKWLRSYSVNRDKLTAPATVCLATVAKYCDAIIPLASADAAVRRATCKKNLLPSDWPWPLPSADLNGPRAGRGGFCDHFFRGNYLCPLTCYSSGHDAEPNAAHLCAREGGQLGGNVCSGVTATCCDHPPCH